MYAIIIVLMVIMCDNKNHWYDNSVMAVVIITYVYNSNNVKNIGRSNNAMWHLKRCEQIAKGAETAFPRKLHMVRAVRT